MLQLSHKLIDFAEKDWMKFCSKRPKAKATSLEIEIVNQFQVKSPPNCIKLNIKTLQKSQVTLLSLSSSFGVKSAEASL